VFVAALILVGVLVWIGATLLIDPWLGRRRRPDLAERLPPFQATSLANEAEWWLRRKWPKTGR
jgi:hypothetical protein